MTSSSLTTSAEAPLGPVDRPLADDIGPSLKQKALIGTIWTIGSVGVGNVLRLAGNLILTRLLFPEAFGMMVMVNVVMQGLHMFSDVGIGPSIIQHKRGDDPAFLNTAWTIQIFRGIGLFFVACLLAWPLSVYRHQPMLMYLLPVTALTALISGFGSTAPGQLHRHMRIAHLTLLELGYQVVNITVMIIFALIWPTVWALVAGGLVASVARLIATHTILSQGPNWFRWDREAVSHLVRFGRWIFISTAFTFLAGQGDKLILGGFLSDRQLGLYGIAFWLSMFGVEVVRKITSKVLFPVYSRLADSEPEKLHRRIRKVRTTVLLAILPWLCVLAVWGSDLVEFLYDPRYHGAGWILRALAIGGIFEVIALTCSPVLLAKGDSFRHMVPMITRCLMLTVAMLIGYRVGGQHGLIAGVAASSILNYPVVAWAVNRYRAWMPGLDLLCLVGCAVFIALATILTHLIY
ncbi:MAG: oligosaccharide flippase family protein [Phycisphaerales bacterium]|nr:MAG: oligosaccharide flippase family protein [Phycisphaerales bacterium]